MTTIEKINNVLDEIRPFLINDGGDIEFVKYEDNIVYVKMHGACKDCDLIDMTIKDGVLEAIKLEIPEVIDIINVD